MEHPIINQLINKVFDKVDDKINKIIETDEKLFIYKGYGIQIKNGIKFKITFFKIINNNITKLFELNNVRIKTRNSMVVIIKYNDIWNYTLYDENSHNLLNYFCKKLNIIAINIKK